MTKPLTETPCAADGEAVELRFNFAEVLQSAIDTNEFSQSLLTRTLENNLSALESLRSGIERAQRKDIEDVRDFGETVAGALLAGVESDVDYEDLLLLIDEYKHGLAHRQLAGMTATY